MTNFGTRKFDSTHLPQASQDQVQTFKKWRELNREKPLAFEIGPGVGLHPLKYSQENPDKCLVAVEHTMAKFEKFQRRFLNHNNPSNLLPVHANAISWGHHTLPNESLSECYILYPNPSPKSADKAKRWHSMPFMERLIELIQVDGTLTLATNMEFYEKEAVDWLVNRWGLQLVERQNLNAENWPFHKHRTHFERKYLQRGEVCYNLIFKKR